MRICVNVLGIFHFNIIGSEFQMGNSKEKKKEVMFDRYIEYMVLIVKFLDLRKIAECHQIKV